MGRFLNPDNRVFRAALNSEIYVDKTGMIDVVNKAVNTVQAFICNSRPRRFGKSVTANMLAAYYSKGCNSKEMREAYPAIISDEVTGLPDAMSLATEETGRNLYLLPKRRNGMSWLMK